MGDYLVKELLVVEIKSSQREMFDLLGCLFVPVVRGVTRGLEEERIPGS